MRTLLIALMVRTSCAIVGKSTYAMSHPFAFKAWMEAYLPTAENVVQENSTSSCNEWVKLCIDDGTTPFRCSGPQGNMQIHAVGAYLRESGAIPMEQIEAEFTAALGGMKKYDPFMELHAAFYTSDLDHYVSAFEAASVPTFAATFTQGGSTYYSLTVQVDGSLRENTGSQLALLLVGDSSALLSKRTAIHRHAVPQASVSALARAHAHTLRVATSGGGARRRSTSSPPSLSMLHVSWPSANVSGMMSYFEGVLGGTKVSHTKANGTEVYVGKLFSSDTHELRWVQSSTPTQGPRTVKAWEAYASGLHSQCMPSPNSNNQGFDRLADNHIGGHGSGTTLDSYIQNQIAAGLPYRNFVGPSGSPDFLYVYGPNGWGYQITGSCSDSNLCGSNLAFYDMCTQGITGQCRTDIPSTSYSYELAQ